MRNFFLLVLLLLSMAVLFVCSPARALEQLNIAYYPGWPCSYQVGQAKGWFTQELGLQVVFKPYDHPRRMIAALKSGDCQIAYSLGITPFTAAVSQYDQLRILGVAVSYSGIDTCVVRDGTGIQSPRDLMGKRVGVPFESVSHYKLLATLKIFGVDPKTVNIYDMPPQDITSAMRWKELDCGCAWEPAVSEMLEIGHLIVSAEDQTRWGMKVFDVIASARVFMEEHPQLLTRFLQVVDQSTRYYRDNFEESARLIADVAGTPLRQTRNTLEKMQFFTKQEQLSAEWLGVDNQPGEILETINSMARFLLEQKAIDRIQSDYRQFIDPDFYQAAK